MEMSAPALLRSRNHLSSGPLQIPDRSGLPSGVFGAGAERFALPSGIRGIPGVGYCTHCAEAGTNVAATTIDVRSFIFASQAFSLSQTFCRRKNLFVFGEFTQGKHSISPPHP